ncbi:MAG: nuclear transport factor 2 family protein [Sphingobacteriaceae bacterium]|nr:MAG: nuclear transport factor 2 family protein [Sphingobacteriaceae bacterium]
MKKAFFIIIFLFINAITFAQTPEDKSIQTSVIRFFDALAAFDNAGMKAELTDDFTLVEHGLIWNADSLINAIAPMKDKGIKRINSLNFTKTEQLGNSAYVVYYNTADMTMGDKKRQIKWLETAFLVKQGARWKIKLLHSTDLK